MDLKQFNHTANLIDGKIILIFGGYEESVLLRGWNTETGEVTDIDTFGNSPNVRTKSHTSTIKGN